MPHISGYDRSQTLLLPESVDDYVGPENPVRFIDAFVDGLDLGKLKAKITDGQSRLRRISGAFLNWSGKAERLSFDVPTLPLLMRPPTFAGAAGAGSSLAAARPGGYRDGAEDATTVPSAAIATTAVTAWLLWIGPVIAGTASVPSGAELATVPGCAGWPGSPSTVPAGTPLG